MSPGTDETIDKVSFCFIRFRRPVRRKRCFIHQCVHWWMKQYQQSVRRTEIREDFRRAQRFFLCIKKQTGFLMLRTVPGAHVTGNE